VLQDLPFHPADPFQTDPIIIESQHRAARMTRTFCEQGMDAFEFKDDEGRHYVVNRATAKRCLEFDTLVSYTSAGMVRALEQPWCAIGRA
jgi:hypothetical protein